MTVSKFIDAMEDPVTMLDLTPKPAAGDGCCGAPAPAAEAPAAAITGAPAPGNADRPVDDARRLALPVAIIGAGPVGLAAAAHLAERGIPFEVYEAGETIADSVRKWGHIRLFSPWKMLVDPAARRLLEATGWTHPDEDRLADGAELVERYLAPLAALPEIAAHVRTGVEVVAVTREGMDRTRTAGRSARPFRLRLRGADGALVEVGARAVIDASGTYRTPNRLGSGGLDALGQDAVAGSITHALPDVLGAERARFAGRRILVVGAGHSAANTLLNLVSLTRDEPGTRVLWLLRGTKAVRVTSSDDDALVARASIGKRVDAAVARGAIEVVDRFEIERLEPADDGAPGAGVRILGTQGGEPAVVEADVIVNATGFRPDLAPLGEIRLDLDDIVEAPRRLAPLIDPNVHSCGTVPPHGVAELRQPEADFYVVGMKSYGRAPTFLLATGYEQVRSVVADLAGDRVAAERVELVLPATGVCSTALPDPGIGAGAATVAATGADAGASSCGVSPQAPDGSGCCG